MRKGSFFACALVGLTAVAACQPLYAGKPDKLVNPGIKRRPPEPPEVEVVIKPIEACVTAFHDDPKTYPRSPSDAKVSAAALSDGDTAMSQANRAPDMATHVRLTVQGIERYRVALAKDPYNPGITVKLALAYDAMYRKGCTLALLKRIGAMQLNPRYQQRAQGVADDVAGNKSSFTGYTSEATAAVGR